MYQKDLLWSPLFHGSWKKGTLSSKNSMTGEAHYRYCPEDGGEHEPDIPDDRLHSYNKSYRDHGRVSANTAPPEYL